MSAFARRSDAEEAATILRGKGYRVTQVAPGAGGTVGLVVFIDPRDIDGPGAFGVVKVTAADILRHYHDPDQRDADLMQACEQAESNFLSFRQRWTNH